MWDLSSAGRASALQAEGHRFEPYRSHMDGFPSGQRGQTVNLLAMPSKVRILLHPLYSKFPGIFAWEFCCHTPKRFESFSIHYILNSQVFSPGSFLSLFSVSAAQRPDTKLSLSALNTQPRGGTYGWRPLRGFQGFSIYAQEVEHCLRPPCGRVCSTSCK